MKVFAVLFALISGSEVLNIKNRPVEILYQDDGQTMSASNGVVTSEKTIRFKYSFDETLLIEKEITEEAKVRCFNLEEVIKKETRISRGQQIETKSFVPEESLDVSVPGAITLECRILFQISSIRSET